jgi:hypothetical protein
MIEISSNGVAVVERTVLDRLVRSGITEERALQHLRDGWVRVDDEPVTDPSHPAAPPTRVDFRMIAEPYGDDRRS